MKTVTEVPYLNAPDSPTDRLMITLFLAVIVHALVILGVGFEFPKPPRINKSLDITLIVSPTKHVPKEADFLAQDNQLGSGKSEHKAEPVRQPSQLSGTTRQPPTRASVDDGGQIQPNKVLTQRISKKKIAVAEQNSLKLGQKLKGFTSANLSKQIEKLGVEIAFAQNNIAKRPRIKFINSVNAHKYKAAAYEKAWQDKVERIGNLNYPDEARRRRLSGSLLLAVGVRRDGSIYNIKIRRSSGHKALDDGAVRIVRLAGPYAPFPKALANDADVLVITRTWKFSDDSHLTTSG